MVLGVVPLVWASGAGAAGRHDMGLVIFAGLSIGTLLTLFMAPAMYMFGARRVELLWELACLRWPHRVLPDTPRCLHREQARSYRGGRGSVA